MKLEAIISGGQTGADRGGLDAGRELGLKIGGFVPKGRRAEDGHVPPEYPMTEVEDRGYVPRTQMNIGFADATVIFTTLPLTGGSEDTEKECRMQNKPHLVLDLQRTDAELVQALRSWIAEKRPLVLNVAGSRESRLPGIQARTRTILVSALRG